MTYEQLKTAASLNETRSILIDLIKQVGAVEFPPGQSMPVDLCGVKFMLSAAEWPQARDTAIATMNGKLAMIEAALTELGVSTNG